MARMKHLIPPNQLKSGLSVRAGCPVVPKTKQLV